MKRDGKNKFYRYLKLDGRTKKIIHWFNDLKEEMIYEKKVKHGKNKS